MGVRRRQIEAKELGTDQKLAQFIAGKQNLCYSFVIDRNDLLEAASRKKGRRSEHNQRRELSRRGVFCLDSP
jgi:hypothetical protein